MHSLREELSEISQHVHSVVILGDLKIHHKIWLRHSSCNTSIGAILQDICQEHGLRQLVREPTRGDYLLDLCCTDLDPAKASIQPKLADHHAILLEVPDLAQVKEFGTRTVWQFNKADWDAMSDQLQSIEWTNEMQYDVNRNLQII